MKIKRLAFLGVLLLLLLLLSSCDNAKLDKKLVGTWKAVKLNGRDIKSFFDSTLPLTTIAVRGYIEKPVKVKDATYQMRLQEDGSFEFSNNIWLWIRPDLKISVGSKDVDLKKSENLGYAISAKGSWAAMPNHLLLSTKEANFKFEPEASADALEMLIDKHALEPPVVGQSCPYRFRKDGTLILMDNAGIFMEFVKG